MATSRRNKQSESSEGAPEWLLTYSDLVTLVLTFFVMLYSMAIIDKQKFEQVANSLRSSFMNIRGGEIFYQNKGKDIVAIMEQNNVSPQDQFQVNNEMREYLENKAYTDEEQIERAKKFEKVVEKLEEAIAKYELGDYVRIVEEVNFVVLRIDSVILFDLGKADIKPYGRDVLKKIGDMLKELDHEITIHGHTDNLPINTLLFPSNWELSTKRATNVVVFLIDNCGLPPEKLTAAGNGEYKPIRPNDSDENRQQNRRIDIVIYK